MDLFSFHVPLLGQSYFMFVDVVRFCVGDGKHLSFYSDRKNEPLRCPLFVRHNHHKEVLAFLAKTPTPLHVERKSKRRHVLSMDKNMQNVAFLVSAIRELFGVRCVPVEVCLSADDNYLGRCGFHVLDLYEMGYAARVPAVVSRPTAFASHDPHIYTGFLLHANNPLQHYPHDYVHLDLSRSNRQHSFLVLSLEDMAAHRPDVARALTPIVAKVLQSIPLKDHDAFLKDWEFYHWVEVRRHHLTTPVPDWKPGLFLHYFARILDLFHGYTLTQRFSVDVVF